ncbi:hypothetical protein BDZ89DRAFT_1038091 [Hymenopellis radicata]|nr:hypothetical protein BDZ89DRAFT_1038091 [Hymenopellis radicata]
MELAYPVQVDTERNSPSPFCPRASTAAATTYMFLLSPLHVMEHDRDSYSPTISHRHNHFEEHSLKCGQHPTTTALKADDDYAYNSGLRRATNTPVCARISTIMPSLTDANTMTMTAHVGRGRGPQDEATQDEDEAHARRGRGQRKTRTRPTQDEDETHDEGRPRRGLVANDKSRRSQDMASRYFSRTRRTTARCTLANANNETRSTRRMTSVKVTPRSVGQECVADVLLDSDTRVVDGISSLLLDRVRR